MNKPIHEFPPKAEQKYDNYLTGLIEEKYGLEYNFVFSTSGISKIKSYDPLTNEIKVEEEVKRIVLWNFKTDLQQMGI